MMFVQQAAASTAPPLHSFAPPLLLPNSTRKKSLSAPSFFAAALGKIVITWAATSLQCDARKMQNATS